MSVRIFIIILSLVALLFGVGFMLIPNQFAVIFGIEQTPATRMIAQFFGDALLAWGMVLWCVRDLRGDALRAVLIATGVGDVPGVIIATMAVMSGVVNAMGWAAVLIYLLAALGSFYFLSTDSSQVDDA